MSGRDAKRMPPNDPTAAPPTSLGRRVWNMSLVWLGFAAFVGPASMPPGGGAVGLVSGLIAGVIVLAPLGAALGLIGGGWKATLCGGAVGLAAGAAAGWLGGEASVLTRAATGLIAGGIAGATLLRLFRLFLRPLLALAALRR